LNNLLISDPPTHAEVQALRDKAGELADDVRAVAGLVHALRRGVGWGWGWAQSIHG